MSSKDSQIIITVFLLDRREKAFKARQKDLKSDQGFSDMGSFDVRC